MINKLIYSTDLPKSIEQPVIGMSFDFDSLKKTAAARNSRELFDYEALKPKSGEVAIHLIALGDYEPYGFNRNGDGFKKEANMKYHTTFKTANVYEHHRNKDPKKRLGTVKAAAYNPEMQRVELVVHVDPEKAAKHIERFEKTGEIPWSMGAQVPRDICVICGHERKTAAESCEHVKYNLGKLAEDGTFVGVFNPEPKFFDISFVTKPADRIAWSLNKVASATGSIITSEERALIEGWEPPVDINESSAILLDKIDVFRKLANARKKIIALSSDSAQLFFSDNLIKAAAYLNEIDDETLEYLREFNTQTVFSGLAKHGAILSPTDFYKYIFGVPDYKKHIEPMMPNIKTAADNMLLHDNYTNVCAKSVFDIRPADLLTAESRGDFMVKTALASVQPLSEEAVKGAIIAASIMDVPTNLNKTAENEITAVEKTLGECYINYKIASIVGYQSFHKELDDLQLMYLAAQQLNF